MKEEEQSIGHIYEYLRNKASAFGITDKKENENSLIYVAKE